MDVREFLKYRSLSVDLTGNVNSVRKGYSPHELRSRFIGFEAEFEKIYAKWFGDVSEGLRGAVCKDLDSVISEQERLVYAGLGNLGKQRWKNYIGGKPGSFLVDESAVFQTDEMMESQKLWPKKKSDAKASNSDDGVAPEVGKIDSMLDAAFGQIKNPLDLPSEELDTSGKFEELKPKEPNITSNGKCYRVSVFTGGRFINQYRYLLTEAIALRHEMVSEIANNLKSK